MASLLCCVGMCVCGTGDQAVHLCPDSLLPFSTNILTLLIDQSRTHVPTPHTTPPPHTHTHTGGEDRREHSPRRSNSMGCLSDPNYSLWPTDSPSDQVTPSHPHTLTPSLRSVYSPMSLCCDQPAIMCVGASLQTLNFSRDM